MGVRSRRSRSAAVSAASAAERAELAQQAENALGKGVSHLRSIQHPTGWWKGELETNVTMDAEDVLLRQFLGILTSEDLTQSARWIRSKQRSDGSWANFFEGPADLSTTVEAYAALRLAGDDPDQAHMLKAAACVQELGGLEASRVFTRMWLALFGLWPWEELPALPPEMIFLPSWFPLNVYDFACWARQTIVALTVVSAYRPVRPIPFGLDELRTGVHPADGSADPVWRQLRSVEGSLRVLDKVLHRYERLARRRLVRATVRETALSSAEAWIIRRQEADGGWGGIQPPWVYSMIALHLRGYSLDHPVMKRALEGLESFTIRDPGRDGEGPSRRLEACQSPVWDTALATIALRDAGVAPSDEAMVRAADWMIGEEVRVPGDWKVRRPDLEPGGWAFEFANDNYPDIDDTAEVLLALYSADSSDPEASQAACLRARTWVGGMVSKDGGWAAFDADNVRGLCRRLPFCDFGEVIDPPSADVTAHVIEMLAFSPRPGAGIAERPLIERGVEWLRANQEADGSWFGRWGGNYVYGTGAAVPALVAAGVPASDPAIRRSVRWLEDHQNDDGGFGEDLRSYVDRGSAGRGTSTASQTAWALLALHAAGESDRAPARRAIRFLIETQREDGTWDEPWYTGTGFPGYFYINYHLYRLVFPISALGRWIAAERRA
jgi:squalene-hopene/tetraprenyl-beta-curcumene cyclase